MLAERLLFVAGGGGRGVVRVFVLREPIHPRYALGHVELHRKPTVGMIDTVHESRVLLRPDAKRRHRMRGAVHIHVNLIEARRVVGGARVKSVHAGKRAELVIERLVLVEDHEDVLHLLPDQGDHFVIGQNRVAVSGVHRIWLDGRIQLRLLDHGRPVIGKRRLGESRRREQRCAASEKLSHDGAPSV